MSYCSWGRFVDSKAPRPEFDDDCIEGDGRSGQVIGGATRKGK